MKQTSQETLMYTEKMTLILNRWFTTYADAQTSLHAEGGYLFPYKSHYFVTQREGVRELGLDPDDPDWAKIGWDWVQPKDSDICVATPQSKAKTSALRGRDAPTHAILDSR